MHFFCLFFREKKKIILLLYLLIMFSICLRIPAPRSLAVTRPSSPNRWLLWGFQHPHTYAFQGRWRTQNTHKRQLLCPAGMESAACSTKLKMGSLASAIHLEGQRTKLGCAWRMMEQKKKKKKTSRQLIYREIKHLLPFFSFFFFPPYLLVEKDVCCVIEQYVQMSLRARKTQTNHKQRSILSWEDMCR